MNDSNLDSDRIVGEITEILNAAVGLAKGTPLDPKVSMEKLGLDSLAAVDFLNFVESKFGIKLVQTDYVDHPTILEFAAYVEKQTRQAAKRTG